MHHRNKFGEGYAPVPLYPEGVWGTYVAKGEGVIAYGEGNRRRKGYTRIVHLLRGTCVAKGKGYGNRR